MAKLGKCPVADSGESFRIVPAVEWFCQDLVPTRPEQQHWDRDIQALASLRPSPYAPALPIPTLGDSETTRNLTRSRCAFAISSDRAPRSRWRKYRHRMAVAHCSAQPDPRSAEWGFSDAWRDECSQAPTGVPRYPQTTCAGFHP